METSNFTTALLQGHSITFPESANTREYAASLDAQDPLAALRADFIIPTKASLAAKSIPVATSTLQTTTLRNDSAQDLTTTTTTTTTTTNNADATTAEDNEPAVYFCGNSLGCQPKAVRTYLAAHLDTWASVGVQGHHHGLTASPLPAWQDLAAQASSQSAAIVGAQPDEVIIMNTLTINLHLMLASFYTPTAQRHKIICEWKPFPSDYYAVESQLRLHGRDPAASLVLVQPDANALIPTAKILAAIDEHADDAALLLLPGIQYYSGQLFDIPRITAYAQARGIMVGWDLAHAAGNVPLKLHDWNVDFAVWCTYKYLNAGPGSIGGCFVHEKHGAVTYSDGVDSVPMFRPRLTGWYGHDKDTRFLMDNKFRPTPGAAGFQCSNPSVVDLASLSGALSVFNKTDMASLRAKSLLLTSYAEFLLDGILERYEGAFTVLTPRNVAERGAQLSVLLRDGLLEKAGDFFKNAGVVCDQRKPGVIRVAPVPIYNNFTDVWKFMEVLEKAISS
ncbi:kynureninase 2 [Pseudovirgaria hyperparasitica]|uniref:Kynureninase n=1 Tax=Pseudovirgaria hyperparasitica TaxID=470096 RepID=A0A6A6WB94_9PEZI|nr:kynureninase 2 [Pseudovirgaria hyperparasitica]KAF2759835.1 kynureninase 2 [Pseudovirgaria hyperparasitica]